MSDDKNPPAGASTDPTEGSAGEPAGGPSGTDPGAGGEPSGDGQDKTYDEKYVADLREEAAAHRVKAKRADAAETRLHEAAIREYTRDLLRDATDLPWSDDLADEDGWPDAEKIKAAAEELLRRKPHLGRPKGDVGQGRHDDTDNTVSLAEILRAGA